MNLLKNLVIVSGIVIAVFFLSPLMFALGMIVIPLAVLGIALYSLWNTPWKKPMLSIDQSN